MGIVAFVAGYSPATFSTSIGNYHEAISDWRLRRNNHINAEDVMNRDLKSVQEEAGGKAHPHGSKPGEPVLKLGSFHGCGWASSREQADVNNSRHWWRCGKASRRRGGKDGGTPDGK